MPLQPNGPAPYTTAAAAITVLDAWRDRGFGTPVTADVLTRVGVPESLSRRTLQSLTILELLDADGNPTQQFADLRAMRGDEEYRTRLQEWLREIYADVLQYANPETDPYERVTEAFRSYEPAGQRRAMGSLLIGLWRYSGLPVAEGPSGGASTAAPRRPARRPAPTRPSPPNPKHTTGDSGGNMAELPAGLVGLLHQIPPTGQAWTTARRDAFLAAFRAVLDFSVPVNDHPATEQEGDEEEVPT